MDGEQPSASLTGDEPPVPDTVRAVVVMPSYNAASTLERTVSDLPADGIAEVILVDDHSSDDTVAIANRLGLTVITHESNRGYGANH